VFSRSLISLALLLCVSTATACRSTQGSDGPPIVQPGAPGQASQVVSAAKASDLSGVRFTAADVRFMQGMIAHHAQALDMTALVRSRTESEGIRTLALRIEVSQADEIRMMQHWLEARAQDAPEPHAMHAHGANGVTMMPGMLTPDEMTRLADAKGAAFDRLFLTGMIKHHGGALIMVRDLFATPGAGQEAEMFAFASDVDADQRMEIDRMSMMLKELPQ
jgi:uncharacterized protein (DUF305 family)